MKNEASPLHKIMGHNLKDIRKKACLSQTMLGKQLGVSFQQIQKYEKGINRIPAEHIYTLKHFFDIPYERFFAPAEEQKINNSADYTHCAATEKLIRAFEKISDPKLKTKALRILTILIN